MSGSTAGLALGIVGAVAGSFVGAPQLGFLLGGIAGQLLFGSSEDVKSEGSRLGDLSVSSSTYGRTIPFGAGTIRMPGNMIWSTGLEEQENVFTVGGGKGFGGPTQTQTTYSYFVSFAMGFAEGVAEDVIRLWFNEELVFDKSSGTIVKGSGLNFRFYPGSETQVPDPLLEADRGVGLVPAHRGMVVIFFDTLDVTETHRVPNVGAEIAFQSLGANSLSFSDDLTVAEGGLFDGIDIDSLAIDRRRRRLYALDLLGGAQGMRVYHLDTLEELRQDTEGNILTTGSIQSVIAAGFDTGNIYVRADDTTSAPWARINPDTLRETGRTAAITGNPNFVVEATVVGALGAKEHFLVLGVQFGADHRLTIVDADDMTIIVQDFGSLPNNITGVMLGKSELGTTEVIITTSLDGDTVITVHRLTIAGGARKDALAGVIGLTLETVGTIPTSTWGTDAIVASNKPPVYDASDDTLIFIVERDSLVTTSTVFKANLVDAGIDWNVNVTTQEPARPRVMTMTSQLTEGLFGFADSSGLASMLRTEDGTIIVDGFDGTTLNANYDPAGEGFFDPETQSVVNLKGTGGSPEGFVQQLFLNRVTGQGDTMANIVTAISGKVGLEPSDLGVTDLVPVIVPGYALTRQSTARAGMEPLALFRPFDAAEIDGVVEFVLRGGASIRTILEEDMVPTNEETGDVVRQTRTQEVELPLRFSVSFMDKDADYEQGTQSAKRIGSPAPTMRSNNEQSADMPIAVTASEAAQIAERALYITWNERFELSWTTGWENLDLDPTDVVTLSLNDGARLERVRITEAIVNEDLTIAFKGRVEDSALVLSTTTGQGSLGFKQQLANGPADTRLFLMDVPLLRDVDETGRVAGRLYVGMNGFVSGWPGGVLFDSTDDLTYTNTNVRVLRGSDYGVLANALPDTPTPFLTDETTVLEVVMQVGALTSVTQTQFINDVNAALVGNPATQNWEIILFRDAVEQSQAGVFDVSTLMRGRRGTEVKVAGHSVGELFIVLKREELASLLMDLSLLNVQRFYRGVGFEQVLEDATVETLQSQHNSLRPYAPAHLDAAVDGSDNVDLSWVRRTRVGGALRDGTGTVPLAEDTEEYEVEILDAPGGAVVRTFLALSSPAVEYTKANIVADLAVATGTTTLGVSGTDTFTRAAGSFVDDGFLVGMTVETTGFTDGANNGTFTVESVAALSLVVVETTLVAESGTGNEEVEAIREADVTFTVHQISAQVGRGFKAEATVIL